MIKALGVIDGVCAVLFVISQFFTLPAMVFYVTGGYLIAKGTLFTVMAQDIASILDIICGLYALSISIGFIWPWFTTIVSLYLLQKAAFSLIRFG